MGREVCSCPPGRKKLLILDKTLQKLDRRVQVNLIPTRKLKKKIIGGSDGIRTRTEVRPVTGEKRPICVTEEKRLSPRGKYWWPL
jgi:hypothetical protein